MCGIAGYIGKKSIEFQTINRTLELMKNRGPDHHDWCSFQYNETNVYLLHSRLSIIDLDERSNQPFSFNDCTLVFNGEVYNYLEVREDLKKLGHNFTTNSDTEVLLKAYIEYGENCVQYFNGMWAFAIWDNNKKKLFLSRDRFAEKPLYYYLESSGVYFGSEIKFISCLSGEKFEINYSQISRYLVNGYKSLYKHGDTFFKEISELSYSSNMLIDVSLEPLITKYWQPKIQRKPMSIEEAIEGTKERIINSVKLRLRSDVPLAFCLSGGVDSAALASVASKVFNYDVYTFSIIDSDERYNEENNIDATINDIGCDCKKINLKSGDMYKRLSDLIKYHDSPLATISYLVHSYLSEAISCNGFKVAVSGTSADEIFTGYYDHFNLHLYEMRNRENYDYYLSNWNTHIRNIVRNPHLQNPELYFEQPDFRDHIYLNNKEFASYLKKDFSEVFIEEDFTSNLLSNRMLNELFYEGTRVILHEDDLNSMMFSIENRSPYLDSELVEFAYSIPTEYLIFNGYGKYILRMALKGILNDKVRLDRRKKGFNASINTVVDFTQKYDRELLLDDSKIWDIIDKTKIEKIIDINPLPNSYSKFLFNVVNTKIFLEKFGVYVVYSG